MSARAPSWALPALLAYARDWMSADERGPLLGVLIERVGEAEEVARAWAIADWGLRTWLPSACEQIELGEAARALRALAPVTSAAARAHAEQAAAAAVTEIRTAVERGVGRQAFRDDARVTSSFSSVGASLDAVSGACLDALGTPHHWDPLRSRPADVEAGWFAFRLADALDRLLGMPGYAERRAARVASVVALVYSLAPRGAEAPRRPIE